MIDFFKYVWNNEGTGARIALILGSLVLLGTISTLTLFSVDLFTGYRSESRATVIEREYGAHGEQEFSQGVYRVVIELDRSHQVVSANTTPDLWSRCIPGARVEVKVYQGGLGLQNSYYIAGVD